MVRRGPRSRASRGSVGPPPCVRTDVPVDAVAVQPFQPAARDALLPRLPPLARDGLVLADSNYDSAPLHAALATRADVRLVHPLRGQHRAGGVRRAAKLRQMPTTRRALYNARLVVRERPLAEPVA